MNPLPVPEASPPLSEGLATPKPRQRKSLTARLKSYSWRITAAYVWLKIVAIFLGGYSTLANTETNLVNHFLAFLSSVGFAPVNTALLSGVLKVGWVLLITGFKMLEILWLLFVYILGLPLWLPVLLIFQRFTSDSIDLTPSEENTPKQKSSWRLAFPVITLLFLAWYLLYGNATTKAQLFPGAVLSCLFSLMLIYRLLLKPGPASETRIPVVRWLEIINSMITKMASDRINQEQTEKGAIQTNQKLNRWTRRFLVRLIYIVKKLLMRNRVPTYVLVEYLVSLIVVAATCVLFWAILIRTEVSPQLPLSTALHLSAAHFLPGVQVPTSDLVLPLWASLGPAATAWILFVLYLGPAASILPEKQKAAALAITETYQGYRRSLRLLQKENRALRISMNRLKH